MGAQCSHDDEVAKTPKRKKSTGRGGAVATSSSSSKKRGSKAAATATSDAKPRSKAGGGGARGTGKKVQQEPPQENETTPREQKTTARGTSGTSGRKAPQQPPSADVPSSPNPLNSPTPPPPPAATTTQGGQKMPVVQSEFVASLRVPLKTVPMMGTYTQEFNSFVKSLEVSPNHEQQQSGEPPSGAAAEAKRTSPRVSAAEEADAGAAGAAAQARRSSRPSHAADERPESRVSQATLPAVVESLDLTPPRPPPPSVSEHAATQLETPDTEAPRGGAEPSAGTASPSAPRSRSVTLVSAEDRPEMESHTVLHPSSIIQSSSPSSNVHSSSPAKPDRVAVVGAAVPIPSTPSVRTISLAELSKHNTVNDAWVAVRGNVLDVTSFIPKHPGGRSAIFGEVGRDATRAFEANHGRPDAALGKLLASYKVGVLE